MKLVTDRPYADAEKAAHSLNGSGKKMATGRKYVG
jgi:hypothetical protein